MAGDSLPRAVSLTAGVDSLFAWMTRSLDSLAGPIVASGTSRPTGRRHQLVQRERFDLVVVRAQLESADPVGAMRGEERSISISELKIT